MEVDAKLLPSQYFMVFSLGWPSYVPVTKIWPSVKIYLSNFRIPLKSVSGYKLKVRIRVIHIQQTAAGEFSYYIWKRS
jgi:hypothetical protein